MQPTQLTENTSDAPSSSSSISADDAAIASCLIYFVVGKESHNKIGYGSLVHREMILVAREILEDYEEDTTRKELYARPANGSPDKIAAQVYSITTQAVCGISIARVSKLFKNQY